MTNKQISVLITLLCIVVMAIVISLQLNLFNFFPDKSVIPSWVFFLPTLNATINGLCALLLLISFYFIKRKNIAMHKRLNLTTFVLSSVFLLSYIIFHSTGIKTTYGGEGPLRTIYYFILITHIILAAVVLPLVLFSFQKGLQMQVEKHRRLVRWSYPIWLYVAISGVLVYLMISPYYSF